MELGHSRDVRLFSYNYAKEAPQLKQDWLVIEQPLGNDWRHGRQGVWLAVGENGVVLIDTNVTGRAQRDSSFSMADIMTIAIENVEASLDASFRLVRALYDDKDPYKRHQRFYWNGALTGMGQRTFARNPQEQRSYSMSHPDRNEPMPAFPEARLITRGDVAQPTKEIERAILYWQRERIGSR